MSPEAAYRNVATGGDIAMTVSTEVDHNDYVGNGVTTQFPYTFRVFKKSDLVVTVLDLSQNMTTLILDTDYTVSGAGGYTGGNVTLSAPLTSGWKISITRVLPVTQETDLRNQGKFFAEVHENAFDKLTMLIQRALSLFGLSLKKPSTLSNYYDAQQNKIANLADATADQDAVNNRTMRAYVERAIAGVVGGFGWFLQSGIGAVYRTFQDKMRDVVSVKDFGVIGDGALHPLSERYSTLSAAQTVYPFATSLSDSIDWAALQAACLSGASGVFIPSGCNLNINKTATIPNINFTLYGCGPSSSIGGSASTLVAFTASEIDPSGNLYTAVVCGIKFKPSVDDAVCINASTIWTGSGKAPHSIKECHFEMKGLRQTGILLSGIWAIKITGNIFHNPVQDSKVVNGGYGIRYAFTNNMNSSVMGVFIGQNNFTGMSYPVYIPPRVTQSGGRAEGVNMTANNMVYGITGLYAVQTLAINATGNQISDFSQTCFFLDGSFGVSISANGELTADGAVIAISNNASSSADSIDIIGNRFALQKDGGKAIQLTNAYSSTVIKGITITGNTFSAFGVSGETYGIFFTGSQPINNVVECGNTFSDIKYGTFFGGSGAAAVAGANTNIQIGPNVYSLNAGGSPVVFPELMSPTKLYEYSTINTFTSTSGQTSVTISVSPAAFTSVPVYADLQIMSATNVRAIYNSDVSTTSSLVFNIVGSIAAGTQKYCLTAKGVSVYGY